MTVTELFFAVMWAQTNEQGLGTGQGSVGGMYSRIMASPVSVAIVVRWLNAVQQVDTGGISNEGVRWRLRRPFPLQP